MKTPGIQLADDLTLPLEVVTETIAILANRGAGKSATARRLVEQLHRAGQPVVVLDVKGDWWGIRTSADGAGPGLPFVIFGGDHADVPLEPTAGHLLADLIVDDHVPAVLDMSHMSKTKARMFATEFAERLYRRNRDPLHVVIEEADVLVPQRATSETARLLGAMEDIAKRGRSRGIGLTLCSQRGQEVAKSVLELMETVVLLRMTGPRSIKAVQDWINVNADVDENAHLAIASLPTLRTGEAWVWSPAFLQLLKRVQIRRFDTFDSHATPRPGRPLLAPKGRAEIDLDKLGADIAATADRARSNDPAQLRAQLIGVRKDLDASRRRVEELSGSLAVRDTEIATLRDQLRTAAASAESREKPLSPDIHGELLTARTAIQTILDGLSTAAVPAEPTAAPAPPLRPTPPVPAAAATPTPAAAAAPPIDAGSPDTQPFRKGARRMLESLGRMAPLRLTKAQWGAVSAMKHTSGTFATYLGELRRAGLIDQNGAGFTLTDAGFDHLGGRPAPMTGSELQQHYLSILRAGARRMLEAILGAYPAGLTREQIAAAAEISASSGTFSTYLGDLRRNELVVSDGVQFVASEMLVRGAAASGSP